MSDDVHGYGAPVWSRFWAPAHAGGWPAGTPHVFAAETRTPGGSGVLRLSVRVEGGRIAEARFQAYGCPVTIAVGEYLAGRLAGAPVAALGAIRAEQVTKSLEITPDKAHCSLQGEDCLAALNRLIPKA